MINHEVQKMFLFLPRVREVKEHLTFLQPSFSYELKKYAQFKLGVATRVAGNLPEASINLQ